MSYNNHPFCSECGVAKTVDNTKSRNVTVGGFQWQARCTSCNSARLRKWRDDNPEKFREINRKNSEKQRKKYRGLVFDYYGHRCVCCGDEHDEFLTIDHIGGGGTAHRKGKGGGSGYYQWIVKNGFPDGLRTLCWNCNAPIGIRGYCPHDQEDDGVIPIFGQMSSEETG